MNCNADRFVSAIFCDDIRQELGGKVSMMGCYQGELLVESMPAVMAKLCIFVTVSTPIDRPLKKLSVRVLQDETELASLEVPGEALDTARPAAEADSARLLANAALTFSPFAISAPACVRIVVTTEEGEMLGPRLRIRTIADDVVTTSVKTDSASPQAKALDHKAPKAPVKKRAVRPAPSK